MTDDFILKNPETLGAKIAGIKDKIHNAMEISSFRLDITRVMISTKQAKLDLITFESQRTVTDIFRLAVLNRNKTKCNAFPIFLQGNGL